MLGEKELKLFERTLKEISARLIQGEPMDSPVCSNANLVDFELRAYSLYRSGNYAQSKVLFHRLILSRPLKQSYWTGLGACLQMEKSYAAALRVWGMSSILDGEDPFPHFYAAKCNFALNDFNQGCLALSASKKLLKSQHQELRSQIEQMENHKKTHINPKRPHS